MYFSHRHQKSAGFSLVELLVAGAVFVMAVVGIYGVYSASLRAMMAADDSAIVSQNLLQRLDQLRSSSWINATNPDYIGSGRILGTPLPATAEHLSSVVEESIKVSAVVLPYASPAPSPLPAPSATPAPFTVKRRGGTVTISPNSPGSMIDQGAVNILVSLTWLDKGNRQHTREMSAIFSKAAMSH